VPRVKQAPGVGFNLADAPGHLIRRAQRVHTVLWSQHVGGQLTSVQFAVLVALAAEPDLDQQALCERVSLDSSSLGDVCARLLARGLVSRRSDPEDRRRNLLRLTSAGQGLLRQATPAVEQVGTALVATLTRREADELLRLLRKLLNSS
jgi:DNA-binding MarR family transcriptional regulator